MASDRRIAWADIAKGIGILLVIAGHTFSMRYAFPIYAFHLPLFFVMTGFLSRVGEASSLPGFVRKKTGSILGPWLLMLAVSLCVVACVPEWRSALTLKAVVREVYTLSTNFAQNSSLWYLPCLFWSVLFAETTVRFGKDRRGSVPALAAGFAVLAASTPIICERLGLPTGRPPFKIGSAFLGTFFICAGYVCRPWIERLQARRVGLAPAVLLMAVACALAWLNGPANVASLTFGESAVAYYPIAMVGVLAVLVLSISVERCPVIRDVLSYYGRHSLWVFGFQSLFIRLYVVAVKRFSGVSLELYGDNPMVHQVMSFVLVSFVLSPLLVCCVSFVNKKVRCRE